MIHYKYEKIGERGGFIHSMGGNFHFILTGFLLKEDGCLAVGISEKDSSIETGWTEGFNRSPLETLEQVKRLPLAEEEKQELIQNGKFPMDLEIPDWCKYKGYPKKNMFLDSLPKSAPVTV